MAGVPEWEYSMFLYITFPFFWFSLAWFPLQSAVEFPRIGFVGFFTQDSWLVHFFSGVLVFPILRCFSCIVVVFL